MNKEKQEIVKKHTSSIHTASKLSLMQRKLMNALLYQAYDYLPVQKSHKVDIKTLCAIIGYDSNDTHTLKNALITLAQTTVEWDILTADDKKRWKVSSLLASAEIENGICEYSYSPVLAKELYNPERFALINMAVQRRFHSSYSLALYENCLRFKKIKTTGYWNIDDFRRLLGVDGIKTYNIYGRLNDLVIKPAIKEINKYSDITIKSFVEKKGRTVHAIRFSIKENTQLPLLGMSDDEISNTTAYKELINRGMSKVFSRQAVLENGEDYIFEQLNIADEIGKSKKIKNSKQSIIRSAIEQGYSKPESLAKKEREKVNRLNKEKREAIDLKLDALHKQQRKIERNYRKLCVDMIEGVFNESSDLGQKEIQDEFLGKYKLAKVMSEDFRVNKWSSLLNWGHIKSYWINDRGLPCPTYDEYSYQHGIKDIEKNIEELKKNNL